MKRLNSSRIWSSCVETHSFIHSMDRFVNESKQMITIWDILIGFVHEFVNYILVMRASDYEVNFLKWIECIVIKGTFDFWLSNHLFCMKFGQKKSIWNSDHLRIAFNSHMWEIYTYFGTCSIERLFRFILIFWKVCLVFFIYFAVANRIWSNW